MLPTTTSPVWMPIRAKRSGLPSARHLPRSSFRLRWLRSAVVQAANGTATASGNDYGSTSGRLTLATGQTAATLVVQVKGDRRREADQDFFVNLTDAVGALTPGGQGRGTILNDDR